MRTRQAKLLKTKNILNAKPFVLPDLRNKLLIKEKVLSQIQLSFYSECSTIGMYKPTKFHRLLHAKRATTLHGTHTYVRACAKALKEKEVQIKRISDFSKNKLTLNRGLTPAFISPPTCLPNRALCNTLRTLRTLCVRRVRSSVLCDVYKFTTRTDRSLYRFYGLCSQSRHEHGHGFHTQCIKRQTRNGGIISTIRNGLHTVCDREKDFLSDKSNYLSPHARQRSNTWVNYRNALFKKSEKIKKIESFFIKQFKDLLLQKTGELHFPVVHSQEKGLLAIEKSKQQQLRSTATSLNFLESFRFAPLLRFGFSFEQVISKLENSQSGITRSSAFKNVLQYTKKLRLSYDRLKKRNLSKIVSQTKTSSPHKMGSSNRGGNQSSGYINSNFLSLLERRLDVALKRAGFFSSRLAAKSMIRRGCVEVNKKKVNSPGYLLVPGDFVTVVPKESKERDFFARSQVSVPQRSVQEREFCEKEVLLSQNQIDFGTGTHVSHTLTTQSVREEETQKIENFFSEKLKAFSYSRDYLIYCLKEKFSNKRVKNKLDRSSFRFLNSPFLLSGLQKLAQLYLSSKGGEDCGKSISIPQDQSRVPETLENWKKSIVDPQSHFTGFEKSFDLRLYYLLELKKQLISYSKTRMLQNAPSSNLSTDKSSSTRPIVKKNLQGMRSVQQNVFYKDVTNGGEKGFAQAKPLHLEISYKSLSFIVLYPVQRVYFSNILDFNSIIKG